MGTGVYRLKNCAMDFIKGTKKCIKNSNKEKTKRFIVIYRLNKYTDYRKITLIFSTFCYHNLHQMENNNVSKNKCVKYKIKSAQKATGNTLEFQYELIRCSY